MLSLLLTLCYYLFYHEKSKIMWVGIKRCKIQKMNGSFLKEYKLIGSFKLLSKSGNKKNPKLEGFEVKSVI